MWNPGDIQMFSGNKQEGKLLTILLIAGFFFKQHKIKVLSYLCEAVCWRRNLLTGSLCWEADLLAPCKGECGDPVQVAKANATS